VIDPPAFDGFLRIVEGKKPMFDEVIVASLAMETLDVAAYRFSLFAVRSGIRRGFAGARSGAGFERSSNLSITTTRT
jgi:hypothetical protein